MIRRALISVWDKRGVEEFARRLVDLGVEVISTGGTAETLRQAGIPVRPVQDLTGFPEILGGRVKTLHPAVHGGILARRDHLDDARDVKEHRLEPIDLVAVNLYPFAAVAGAGAELETAIEHIDIGGPALIRAAAKNHRYVTVVTDPDRYPEVLEQLERDGQVNLQTRYLLAQEAFEHTAHYDAVIAGYLGRRVGRGPAALPDRLVLAFDRVARLRYGENPHQEAAFYRDPWAEGASLATARQLHGKPLSYNNLQDADAALALVREFHEPAAVAVKHAIPCGVACGEGPAEAVARARDADPVSIFGGIVAFNRPVDEAAAREMADIFLEVVLAPEFEAGALRVLGRKRDLRLLALGPLPDHPGGGATEAHRREQQALTGRRRMVEYGLRKVAGGVLLQEADLLAEDPRQWKLVTRTRPGPETVGDLWFAWRVVKHARSNAIVVARDRQTLGVGAGYTNRVDAARYALERAGDRARGAVLASDAFFPFPDTVEVAAAAGISAVVQPGGSVRDAESVAACDAHGIAMLFTGVRHFNH